MEIHCQHGVFKEHKREIISRQRLEEAIPFPRPDEMILHFIDGLEQLEARESDLESGTHSHLHC